MSPPPVFEVRQEVEVWQGANSRTLHAVVVAGDSLSGIPHFKPVDCDSCRIVVPIADVDSLRKVTVERTAILMVAVPVAVFVAVVAAWRVSEED